MSPPLGPGACFIWHLPKRIDTHTHTFAVRVANDVTKAEGEGRGSSSWWSRARATWLPLSLNLSRPLLTYYSPYSCPFAVDTSYRRRLQSAVSTVNSLYLVVDRQHHPAAAPTTTTTGLKDNLSRLSARLKSESGAEYAFYDCSMSLWYTFLRGLEGTTVLLCRSWLPSMYQFSQELWYTKQPSSIWRSVS